MPRDLDEVMAVAAVHSKLLYVEGVGEGDRLVGLVADPGVIRSEVIPDPEGDRAAQNEHADQQLQRQPVGRSGKEIRHRERKECPEGVFAGRNRVKSRPSKARLLP